VGGIVWRENYEFKINGINSRMNQLALIETTGRFKLFAPKKGKRKEKRPLSTKHPIHLVLKSSKNDLKCNEREILKWWSRFCRQFGIKCYRVVVNRDHLHAVVRIHSAHLFTRFVRAFSGTLARCLKIKWLNRPATRIGHWGRDFKRLLQYLKLNLFEAEGFIDYQPSRTRRLPHWLKL
jgi:REP element-mobilizing transposase RayT